MKKARPPLRMRGPGGRLRSLSRLNSCRFLRARASPRPAPLPGGGEITPAHGLNGRSERRHRRLHCVEDTKKGPRVADHPGTPERLAVGDAGAIASNRRGAGARTHHSRSRTERQAHACQWAAPGLYCTRGACSRRQAQSLHSLRASLHVHVRNSAWEVQDEGSSSPRSTADGEIAAQQARVPATDCQTQTMAG